MHEQNGKSYTYKSMKTAELKEQRDEEIQQLDDSSQLKLSKHQLGQFNQIKKILMNFGFKDRQKNILSTEINSHVLDEMRRERKIIMVLRDADVD